MRRGPDRGVTTGPYAIVRNPIYLGFLGLAVATGVVISKWLAILAAVPLFIAGTLVRVRAEEQLLLCLRWCRGS